VPPERKVPRSREDGEERECKSCEVKPLRLLLAQHPFSHFAPLSSELCFRWGQPTGELLRREPAEISCPQSLRATCLMGSNQADTRQSAGVVNSRALWGPLKPPGAVVGNP
jgi:hypothetical protein